jgi:hypothetical protein
MNKWLASFALAGALTGCLSEDELGSSESDITVNGWLDDLKIPNAVGAYQVGLSQLGTKLHMMYFDSSPYATTLKHATFDGSTWTRTSTNLQADYGPALTTFNNQLYTIYHGYNQDRLLMSSSSDGTTWSLPQAAGAPLSGATVRYAPAAGVMNSAMFIAYCIHDSKGDHVRVDQKLSTSWVTKQVFDVHGTCESVALGSTPDRNLRLIYVENYDGVAYMNDVRLAGDAGGFNGPYLLTFKSKKPPSVTTCNGILHMVHGGNSTPGEIWWSYLGTDGKWVADKRVPNQTSDGGAQLACYNGDLLMVHNGGYDQLWWSQYVPD